MHLVPQFNNICTHLLNIKSIIPYVLLASIACIMSSNVKAEATLEIIGNITKGTCFVTAPTQEVLFKKGVVVDDLKEDITDKSQTVPFTFKYQCQEFDTTSSIETLVIKITPSSNTEINNHNVIYPKTNTVNAGFVLRSCDQDRKNCQIVSFAPDAEVPFKVVQNGDLETQFEVSLIKLNNQPAKSGELIASVDLTLIQP